MALFDRLPRSATVKANGEAVVLSVLGGVQALGPIGIVLGPMVVSFLQALLTILQKELTALDRHTRPARGSP